MAKEVQARICNVRLKPAEYENKKSVKLELGEVVWVEDAAGNLSCYVGDGSTSLENLRPFTSASTSENVDLNGYLPKDNPVAVQSFSVVVNEEGEGLFNVADSGCTTTRDFIVEAGGETHYLTGKAPTHVMYSATSDEASTIIAGNNAPEGTPDGTLFIIYEES